jgi:hypothetical protein
VSFEFLDPALLLAAFAGGLFGAAIGGLPAFIFTGFAVLLGVAAGLGGSKFNMLAAPDEPQGIAFGVVFGLHISLAGGAAAAAFAARRGDIEDGKDIATPLAGLGTPWPLLVGGLFGVGGLVVQQLLVGLLGTVTAVTATDTIAVTVVISAIVARLTFGKTGLFGNLPHRPANATGSGPEKSGSDWDTRKASCRPASSGSAPAFSQRGSSRPSRGSTPISSKSRCLWASGSRPSR